MFALPADKMHPSFLGVYSSYVWVKDFKNGISPYAMFLIPSSNTRCLKQAAKSMKQPSYACILKAFVLFTASLAVVFFVYALMDSTRRNRQIFPHNPPFKVEGIDTADLKAGMQKQIADTSLKRNAFIEKEKKLRTTNQKAPNA